MVDVIMPFDRDVSPDTLGKGHFPGSLTPLAYIMPNDDVEQERPDMAHAMMVRAIGNKLFLAPLEKEKIHQILDIGTGTGICKDRMRPKQQFG